MLHIENVLALNEVFHSGLPLICLQLLPTYTFDMPYIQLISFAQFVCQLIRLITSCCTPRDEHMLRIVISAIFFHPHILEKNTMHFILQEKQTNLNDY